MDGFVFIRIYSLLMAQAKFLKIISRLPCPVLLKPVFGKLSRGNDAHRRFASAHRRFAPSVTAITLLRFPNDSRVAVSQWQEEGFAKYGARGTDAGVDKRAKLR